jgi:hypothetical protein
MNDISNGNWELRRENMFHSIIEEQLSTATLSMFDCASGSSEFRPNETTFPHFAQHEKANPAQARRFTNFKSRTADTCSQQGGAPLQFETYPSIPR